MLYQTPNYRPRFYDYFKSASPMRLRIEFGFDSYAQTSIRMKLQSAISIIREQLLAERKLKRICEHMDSMETYDDDFYDQLKCDVIQHFDNPNSWDFLDELIQKRLQYSKTEQNHIKTKLLAATGSSGGQTYKDEKQLYKYGLVSLFKRDLNVLHGKEINHLLQVK